MAKYATVCHDCGATSLGPAHKKFCSECRLLKDVDYWQDRQGTCQPKAGGCGKRFVPVRRNDLRCGECVAGHETNIGECILCHKERTFRLVADIAVCERCARDVAKRTQFIKGLRNRRAKRRAEHDWKQVTA